MSTQPISTSRLDQDLDQHFDRDSRGIFTSNMDRYWSNLDKDQNEKLLNDLPNTSTQDLIRRDYPHLENIIFSPKRAAGLELLGLTGSEVCMDFGAMWGALSIPLAQRTQHVYSVDQTYPSLVLLKKRAEELGLDNVSVVHHDIKKMPTFKEKIDVAIVNGVLEWIPDDQSIELGSFFKRKKVKRYSQTPKEMQLDFLNQVRENLSDNGRLYLAIENSIDFAMFVGKPDPHSQLLFTSFLPRFLANIISIIRYGRPYRNWIYSFGGTKCLLKKAGFSKVELYMCFPDYRFPNFIFPYKSSYLKDFVPKPSSTVKGHLYRFAKLLIYRVFRMKSLSPGIIAIATK